MCLQHGVLGLAARVPSGSTNPLAGLQKSTSGHPRTTIHCQTRAHFTTLLFRPATHPPRPQEPLFWRIPRLGNAFVGEEEVEARGQANLLHCPP